MSKTVRIEDNVHCHLRETQMLLYKTKNVSLGLKDIVELAFINPNKAAKLVYDEMNNSI